MIITTVSDFYVTSHNAKKNCRLEWQTVLVSVTINLYHHKIRTTVFY